MLQVEWVSRWRDEHEKIQAVAMATKEAEMVAAAKAESAAAPAAAASGAGDPDRAAAAVSSSEAAAAAAPDEFIYVGTRVRLDDGRVGTVRFKGPVFMLNKGTWYGVELDDASGKNDGDHKGETSSVAISLPCCHHSGLSRASSQSTV